MSQGQVVRQPLAAREHSSRTLDQRFAVRFQRLAHAYARLVFGLPPTRRFRQAALARITRSAIEAYNRLDVEPFLIPFHPEATYEIAPEMAGLGITASDFSVHEGLQRYWEEGRKVWPDLRIDPQEL